jgi:two-component system CheB/CheR fusion protein
MGDGNLDFSSSMGKNQAPRYIVSNGEEMLAESSAEVSDWSDEALEQSSLSHPIVGIGVPDAGVEDCVELFRHLDVDTGMAFVVIPENTRDQVWLSDLLARHTSMPVVDVKEAVRPDPNHVYVLPENPATSFQRGHLCIGDRKADEPERSIDAFLTSLAASLKSRAIGVVLCGANAEGSIGLRAVKGHSGIAIISDRKSHGSENGHNGISLDCVDRVLPPGQIAIELGQIGRQFRKPLWRAFESGGNPQGGAVPYFQILELLGAASDVEFRFYKPGVLRRRIARRMLINDVQDLSEYVAFLQSNPQELKDLQEDVFVCVTQFFRDPQVFAVLRDTILPQIFAHRSPGQSLRIWVPGCASGEEVYSYAICVLEYLADRQFDAQIRIFGSDVSQHAIETARAGIYPESLAQEVSAERLRKFFVKIPEGYQVSKLVRDLCVFAQHDLCKDPPFSKMDLVSCRNVLTYLEPQPRKGVLANLHYALRPDGLLLLGSSETIYQADHLFQAIDQRRKIFARLWSGPSRAKVAFLPRPSQAEPSGNGSGNWADKELRRAADKLVLARYGPPGIVVDEKLRILQSRGHTSPFLEMPQGRVSLKVARMLRNAIAAPVIEALQRAVEQDLPVRVEGLRVSSDHDARDFTLEVLPLRTQAPRTRCFLVLFAPADMRRTGAEDQDGAPESQEELIDRLRQDLSSTRLYLQTLLEERDLMNRELALSNQEVQSAVKATNHANQESANLKSELGRALQALQTVDALQERNRELEIAADDLTNLFNSVNVPVLHLGNELAIQRFSTPAQRLMNLSAADLGRPLNSIRLNLLPAGFARLFHQVLESLTPGEMDVEDDEGRSYVLRASPYRTADNRIGGVVLALVDVERFRRREKELLDARDFALSQIESMPTALVVVDLGLRIRGVNEAFRNLAGIGKEDLSGRSFPDLASARWGLDEPLRTHLENLRNSKDVGGRFMFEHMTSGEKARVLDIRGCGLKGGKGASLLVTVQDITAHKDVERFLALEGERLASEVANTARELGRAQDELRALAASLLQSQEEERRRVARELHDDISQKLALLEIDAQQVEPQINADPARARSEVERLRASIADLSEEVRRISHALHPSAIEDLGVGPAIRSLVEDFREREEMIVTFRAQAIPEGIPLEVATGLYRITQEALRNISKHAGKTHVKVLLDGEARRIRLQVIDSGKGFDPQARRLGLGLISIGERARIMQGTVSIESKPGEGTRIAVDVPLP